MSNDAQNAGAGQGWTLQDAMRRTIPERWEALARSREALDKLCAPPGAVLGGFIKPAPELVAEHKRAVIKPYQAAEREFREILVSGALIATGSRGERSVMPTVLHTEGWRTLRFINLEKSIVREIGSARTRIYNVRAFPLVHSDEAAERLAGRSLVEAFQRCVLRDPEVMAASRKIPEQGRIDGVFTEGRYPGPFVRFHWPLDLNASDLAFDFVRPVLFFLDRPAPVAPPQVKHLAAIVTDRWTRLRQRLIDGELLARGTYERTGEFQYINSLQWSRQEMSIDVKSGDLLDGRESGKLVLRWSGVSFVKPNSSNLPNMASGLADNAGRSERAASDVSSSPTSKMKRRSPKADAVAAALKRHGLELSPDGHTWTDIAGIIADDMLAPPNSEHAYAALAKAIERHYRTRATPGDEESGANRA